MMNVLKVILFWILLAQTHVPGADRPNFIVVFIDDMGWGDLSCYGNDFANTPHIDTMAREGIRFEHFYVSSPICSPSRVGITTGQYPQRWRITSFLNNREHNRERGMAQWLDPQAPVLARYLQEAGYATGHFGKWHMGGQRDVGEAPLISEYGFDESLTNFEGLGSRVIGLKNAYDGKKPLPQALGSHKLGRGEITYMDRSRVTGAFTEAAIEFIDHAVAQNKPFYLNIWPDDVHKPLFPSEEGRGDERMDTLYKSVLEEMDEQLDAVFTRIRNDDHLRGNTLVLICSDNGPALGVGSAGPFKGSKVTLYEGGVRSPLIAWGPGLVQPGVSGKVNTADYFSAMDLVPSILEIARVRVPEDEAFDGIDISGILLGSADSLPDRPLFFRRPPGTNTFSSFEDLPDLAVRMGKWKLLCEYDGEKPQLYNLADDPGETVNLAGKYPQRTKRLKTRVLEWNGTMPQDNGYLDEAASPDTTSYLNPVQENIADPAVLKHDGKYYLYCTYPEREGVDGIGLYTSDDLVQWNDRGFALTNDNSWGDTRFWAPHVIHEKGRFYMYYSSQTQICVAESLSPEGPFKMISNGPLWKDRLRIDPFVFKDDNGEFYLYFVQFNKGNEIWVARLNDDMISIDRESLVRLIQADQPWEQQMGRIVEGPEVLKHKDLYYLTYSGSHFKSRDYAVGYAVSESPVGPFRKVRGNPVLRRTDKVFGPGHHCFTTSPDGSELFIVYHTHRSKDAVQPRNLSIDRARFIADENGPDRIKINGPSSTPQPSLIRDR